jgi:hypothetical protein
MEEKMSSKRSLKVVKLLVIAAVVSCAFAGTASAQSYLDGTFTLPYEVRWQGAILPAGDYSITMTSSNSPALLRAANGGGGAFVLARCVDPARKGAPTSLLITRQGNERVVRFFNWKERGVNFVYKPLTKAERTQLASVEQAEIVPIRMASN